MTKKLLLLILDGIDAMDRGAVGEAVALYSEASAIFMTLSPTEKKQCKGMLIPLGMRIGV